MHDAGALSRALAARAELLCRVLLPGGSRKGGEWRAGSVDGEAGGSLAVRLGGPKAGVWLDHATGESGDLIGLIKATRRCEFKAAAEWAESWLGESAAPMPARLQDTTERRSQQDEEGRRNAARRIFLTAELRIAGTPVDAYLRGRGIDLQQLGRQPRALRYAPALWNGESRTAMPAMVAAVCNGAGAMTAVHRTWLCTDGAGRWRKAQLSAPKMALGPVAGGCIRLWRGASGKPLAQAPMGETVLVAEGLENALSIAVSCPEMRVLCAVSIGNLGLIELPPQITGVIIAADGDSPGSKAERALHAAARRLASTGRQIRIARSPLPGDLNDLLVA